MTDQARRDEPTPESGLTRRKLLSHAGVGGSILVGASVLAACGGSSSGSSTTGTSASAGTPKRGGTLRVGISGGGSGDSLDGENPLTSADGTRDLQLYNYLATFNSPTGAAIPSLAEEMTPNADSTEWTIRVHKGVLFHDGKPLTTDDLIYSFSRIQKSKVPLPGQSPLAVFDFAAAKALDDRTIRVPTHVPYAFAPELFAQPVYPIIPTNWNEKNPVGTGPFKFVSFTPGQQSTFDRNEHYWETGLPYVDKLIISDYADESSQVNALVSGVVDLINALSHASIAPITAAGAHVLTSNGGNWTPFTMRSDQPPFNDIRVRQAFRLLVDRDQMRQTLFGDAGLIGNDVFAPFDPDYDHSLPQRKQDIEQAKSLLKQAGKEGLNITLTTSPMAPDSVQAATVFAQQASAAGVTVKLNQVPPPTMFGPNFLKWQFAQDIWTFSPYLAQAQYSQLPNSSVNECHVNNQQYAKLISELQGTPAGSRRTELTHECMKMDYEAESSGYIIPYFTPELDGYASHVEGLHKSVTGNAFGDYDLKHVWLNT